MSVLSRVQPSRNGTSHGGARTGAGATPAQRLTRSRWRQPRLVVGVLLVAAAVVLGTRVISALDDSVLVWRVDDAARAGSPASGLAVRPVTVRFDDAQTQGAYLSAEQPVPYDRVLTRDVAPGQLVATADLGAEVDVSAGQLPIDVPTGSLPADLLTGDRIDVWVVPEGGVSAADGGRVAGSAAAFPAQGVQVLAQSRVAEVTAPGATVGDTRQVLVDLSIRDAARLDDVLGALASGVPVVVRVPQQTP